MLQTNSSQQNPAVIAHRLTRRFGSFTAVDSIDFTVGQGEIFGFLGANGAGKTTAIRMLCGILKPSSGSAIVNGYSISTDSEQIKRSIGYMSQRFSLYEDMTINENMTFFGGVYGLLRTEIARRATPLLARLGLNDKKNTLTGSLPLGFKQRLALGCATLHNPRVLFLDEPTAGVDPVARRDFWELIYEFSEQKTTVFVTTHYMDEAEYCQRVLIMKDGRITALGEPAELKSTYSVDSMQDLFHKVIAG